MICSVKQSTAISLSNVSLRHNSPTQTSFLRPSMSTTTANALSSKKPLCVSSQTAATAKFPRNPLIVCRAQETDQSQSVETNIENPNQEDSTTTTTTEPTKAAKIHDFCFGIPFGGIVLSGGFVGFLFSRNFATLGMGVLYGGALLALSTFSMKVWRQGKSSLPFILGQAALAAALFWKHFQNYSLTKKLFPAGFYAVMSAAMLCFYSYVMLSGGNPPPKKLKLEPIPSS